MDGNIKKLRLSIVVIGDEKVGKTSVIVRYCMKVFKENYSPTLCSDYYKKTLAREDLNTIVDLDIWDIGGQDHYKADRDFYLKRGMVVVIMFAVDDLVSFMDLKKWTEYVRSEGRKDVRIMLVGNKIDLRPSNSLCITRDQLLLEAIEIGCDAAMETSAKEDTNVRELFDVAIDLCNGLEPPKEVPLSDSM